MPQGSQPPKGVIIIDILQLVDRLEELLDKGWRVPMSNRVVIDASVFTNIVDQMRMSIPQEVQRGREILRDRDRLLTQAQDEARQIIAQAREDAEKRLDERRLQAAANAEADEILRDARRQAAEMRAGVDDYAAGQLRELGKHVAELMNTIRNGIEVLEKRRAAEGLQAGDGLGTVEEGEASGEPLDDDSGSVP